MTAAVSPFARTGRARQTVMLAGASVLALTMASERAFALQINGSWLGSNGSATNYAAQAAQQATKQQSDAAARSQDAMVRALAAMRNLTQLQQAAHAIAAGQTGGVPNGLTPGGLVPAVSAPTPATSDPTGIATWDGAALPTQTKTSSGITDVTIEQLKPQAILSWTSFNIGSNTSLTFDQQGNSSWVVLNRVVAGIAPSTILGAIHSDGTVLVINRNGVIFGGSSQINVGSLIASTLDIGVLKTTTTYQSNQLFLQPPTNLSALSYFGADKNGVGIGDIMVQPGAEIETASAGQIILMGHRVTNEGTLSSPDGQVILAAGDSIFFTANTGDAQSADPNVRGLLVNVRTDSEVSSYAPNSFYVDNAADGVIEADRGNITLSTIANTDITAPVEGGAILNQGGLYSTTSVSRNGSVILQGGDIDLAGTGVISIAAETNGETIPQDPTSLGGFKNSEILIGNQSDGNVSMQSGAFVYAPSATVKIGSGGVNAVADPINGGQTTPQTGTTTAPGYVASTYIASGAEIDVAGIANVEVPATRNQVTIDPVKGNELRDTPLERMLLNGATIYLDPRKSGVRADGVAWIGSPLIDATAYYQLFGVGAAELMTKGGNVSIAGGAANVAAKVPLGGVVIRPGAVIDVSGGWVTYDSGVIRESKLIDANGRIVSISNADPSQIYLGVYNGFSVDHSHWGIIDTYSSPLMSDSHFAPGYTEGRDAGSLSIDASTAALNETLLASSYAGLQQIADSKAGTAVSSISNDHRALQAAPSQLPSGGLLSITSGVDIDLTDQPEAPPATFAFGAFVRIGADGSYRPPSVQAASGYATTNGPLQVSDSQAADSGLAQLSLASSGSITVSAGSNVALQAGGAFTASSGRAIDIEGAIDAAGGTIDLKTGDGGIGSLLSPSTVAVGSFDINVTGDLSVAGQWVNDYQNQQALTQNHAFLNGGTISMFAASGLLVTKDGQTTTGGRNSTPPGGPVTDVSGSIIIDPKARLRLSSGGRVDQFGNATLTATGGNLSLRSATAYFETQAPTGQSSSGFRVINQLPTSEDGAVFDPLDNPSQINAHISFDPGSIAAQGFGGGGTFTLQTPQFTIGSGTSSTGTEVPLDFFSKSGFATFDITSAKTALLPSTFENGFGGYNALLQTQTITIKSGEVLSLSQSLLPSFLDVAQTAALRQLATGGDVTSILSPITPTDAYDQKAVDLNFGGLIELDVAQGGKITGAAGSVISASKILNEGTIRIAGGTVLQDEVLPAFYGSGNGGAANGQTPYIVPAIGIHSLGDVFTINADGTIDPNASSKIQLFDAETGTYTSQFVTNGDLAGNYSNGAATPIYLLGKLGADQGIVLASGSVTDLSGTVLTNPRAVSGAQMLDVGRTVGGGTIATAPTTSVLQANYLGINTNHGFVAPEQFVADPGAKIDLSGVATTFDLVGLPNPRIGPRQIGSIESWSDAGALIASNGATLTGAVISAHGGNSSANGGELEVLSPILVAQDPGTPTADVISAAMISQAGFDSLIAVGSVSSEGDVTLHLRDKFVLQGVTYDTADKRQYVYGNNGVNATAALVVPQVRSEGGRLEIDAGYVALQSTIDRLNPVSEVNIGVPGNGSVVFNAGAIDVSGAVLFDRSVASATLSTTGDLRLIGIEPYQLTYSINSATVAPALNGALAVNGNLDLIANRIYPTTGSTFAITSAATDGTITLGRSGNAVGGAPYSAGGNLSIDAATIVDGGNVRVPFGTLTLGSSKAVVGSISGTLAPATQTVTILDGSITGVSADGLDIPYGTTTDLKEWFFTPTSNTAVTAPPSKVLAINASNITIAAGATIDDSGGGDVYTYEFVAGTGGSHDVLSRFNSDPYSSNNGYQYPDQRQVFAIVPGLSSAEVAAYDPIYSADYAAISTGSLVGERVYLDASAGLKAGWYTLLPAQYALLPGGMRVVEQTGATNVIPGTDEQNLDGSSIVSGHYGNAIANTSQSQERLFSVENQATFLQYSNIVTTSGNADAVAAAAKAGTVLPQIGLDAGRLILNPSVNLTIDAAIDTAAAPGGRGAIVDIGGKNFDIVSELSQAPEDGAIHLTADSLDNLNAASLLIGGFRTDNADGTTNLTVTAQSITVANDAAHPITASEILLAVDDLYDNSVASHLTLKSGATLIAKGSLGNADTGDYVIDGTTRTVDPNTDAVTDPVDSGHGALVRVANGPQRLVLREIDPANVVPDAVLNAGAATLSGTSLMLDSSDQNHLSSGLVFKNDQEIAVGANRIGFGADPQHYAGLVITDALQGALTANGAALTLRSQSSIDFAGGTYDFNNVTFDASSVSDLDAHDVTINANTVGLGNIGAAADCTTCAGSNAHLSIVAKQILLTGGSVSLKGAVLDTTVAATLASDAQATLPAGTVVFNNAFGFDETLSSATTIIIPKGTPLSALAGLGLSLTSGVDGTSTLNTGSQVTTNGTLAATIPTGAYTIPNTFYVVGSGGGTSTETAGSFTLVSATSAKISAGSVLSLSADASVTRRSFFGGGVTLQGQTGIFTEGQRNVLDVGAAPLTLATPLLADRVLTGLSNEAAYDATFKTAGDLSVVRGALASVDGAGVAGTPGSAITLIGQNIDVDGSYIRATAGTVMLDATQGISVGGGATIAAPGYTKTFGDSVDAQVRSATGGAVTLSATDGAIVLGDALLSVAGGAGNAGTLTLSSPNGAIDLSQVRIDGSGATGGTFVYDAAGNIDASALNTIANQSGFTGGFNVTVAQGDLTLDAGQTLRSAEVSLTANDGSVDIAGTIDTSGINGGDISLYGRQAVVLESTAVLRAQASGYGTLDTRQARGGDVVLGTDFVSTKTNIDGSIAGISGVVTVKAGALVDVSALHPGDRLVPVTTNGITNYQLVLGDTGGTLSFRAPVVLDASGKETVDVDVASSNSVVGASAVTVEGFRRWDLEAVAQSGKYVGVTCSTSPCEGADATVTLDVTTGLDTATIDGTRTVVRGVNFLGDNGGTKDPTVVDFIQDFDLSAGTAYGNLGGLADQVDFHAQPGVDLYASGNIVLASNWNLGAGTVDLAAAAKAGDVTINPLLQIRRDPTSGYVVTPGKEADIFQNYTTMVYRTGGSVAGEAPIVTLRGGGNVTVQGSVSDGTFLFRDQTDPTYLAATQIRDTGYVATTGGYYIGAPGQSLTTFAAWDGQDYYSGGTDNYLTLALFGGAAAIETTTQNADTVTPNQAPYNALGNSPAALEQGGSGDPIGSAIVFPLLADNKAASSSSYRIVAGAQAGSASTLSVDPAIVDRGSSATLTIAGLSSYKYYNEGEYTQLGNPMLFVDTSYNPTNGIGSGPQTFDRKSTLSAWLAHVTSNPKFNDNSLTIIYLSDGFGDMVNQSLVDAAFSQFVQARGLRENRDYRFSPSADGSGAESSLATTQYIATTGKNFKDFVQNYLIPLSTQLASNIFNDSTTNGFVQGTTIPVQSSVRTGTGSIALAASGNVDLRGLVDPVYFDATIGITPLPTSALGQLGGDPVYTLGRRADPTTGTETLVDPLSGAKVTVDLSSGFVAVYDGTSFLTGGGPTDSVGTLAADPVVLTSGGDVKITAGADVLGRYSAFFNNNAGTVNTHPWDIAETTLTVTLPDGSTVTSTSSGIDPQLFREGIGALGGGNIAVDAGGAVSDVTFAVDGAVVYGSAVNSGGGASAAAARFGGGNIRVDAGSDIVGGRIDLASGAAVLVSGGSFTSSIYQVSGPSGVVATTNALDIAANDATVTLSARGAVTVAEFQPLGGGNSNSQTSAAPSATPFTINSYAPSSALKIVANGDVAITDTSYIDSAGVTQATPFYPGSLTIDALNGSIDLPPLVMDPSPEGQLRLYAGWDVDPTAIAMLDNVNDVLAPAFPALLPSVTSTGLANLHDPNLTHKNDPIPAYIYAGRDLDQLTLSLPKQARIYAGRDIVDMAFFGQNLSAGDITRIVAGRDITATTRVVAPESRPGVPLPGASPEPALQGNTFVIGGPGTFMLEAGRDLGPFLNSAVAQQTIFNPATGTTSSTETFYGGVLSVGNLYNPYLPATSSDLDILFGIAKGADFVALRDDYVAAGTTANATGDYSAKLLAWMQANQAPALQTDFGTTNVTADQAYAAFVKLSDLQQQRFLIRDVYFNELAATVTTSPTVYQRGYQAVNTLFPSTLGYTANSLSGGSNGASSLVSTGDLDLRLATLQTQEGGTINILGPGGNILAGSVVATAVQAARHSYEGYNLYSAAPLDYSSNYTPFYNSSTSLGIGVGTVLSIPPGGEGILTLRGGDINSFTDGNLLINQSRLFTEGGGNIVLWSSNGDLNAGQGPKTSADFPPIVVTIDDYGHTTVNQAGSVTGAGIAALAATPDAPQSNVDLIAPRGTVDAGDAGVRVSGNLTVAALTIVNADNFQVSGASVGIPTVSVPSVSLSSAGNAAAAATKSVDTPTNSGTPASASIIIVEFLGYGGGDDVLPTSSPEPNDPKKKKKK